MYSFKVTSTVTFSAENLLDLGRYIGATPVGRKYKAGIHWLFVWKGLPEEQAKEILESLGVEDNV